MIKTPESETSGCVFETLQNFFRHPLLLCTKALCTCNQSFNCLFVCLFGFFRPTRESFTDMKTSPLPVKSCTV